MQPRAELYATLRKSERAVKAEATEKEETNSTTLTKGGGKNDKPLTLRRKNLQKKNTKV